MSPLFWKKADINPSTPLFLDLASVLQLNEYDDPQSVQKVWVGAEGAESRHCSHIHSPLIEVLFAFYNAGHKKQVLAYTRPSHPWPHKSWLKLVDLQLYGPGNL